MVISLASGLAVSSRSTSTVHQTANLSDSEQALATAESEAEKILRQNIGVTTNLNTVLTSVGYNKDTKDIATAGPCATAHCFKQVAPNIIAEAELKATPDVGSDKPFNFYLENEDVQQVWLEDSVGNLYTGNVNVCWNKNGTELGSDSKPAALEITAITGTSSYTMIKYDYDADMTRRGTNGFTAPGGSALGVYSYCTGPIALSNGQALRIHGYYTGTSVSVIPVKVLPTDNDSIPFQGHIITTTVYSGSTKRTLEVTKTLPQLPAIFDYGIYSGGGLN